MTNVTRTGASALARSQDDAAARTLAYLKVVWNAGGKATVQTLIKDITVAR